VVSDALHEGLNRLARTRNCSKNKVIVQAIEDYLARHEVKHLAAEARRQSLLASPQPEYDQVWFDLPDTSGWE
jgi:hypothetical protein